MRVSWFELVVSDWVSQLENFWGFSRMLLLLEADSWGRGQFGNPEEGERLTLEVANKRRQKTWLWTLVCVCNSEL
jgi:hypothetical protein